MGKAKAVTKGPAKATNQPTETVNAYPPIQLTPDGKTPSSSAGGLKVGDVASADSYLIGKKVVSKIPEGQSGILLVRKDQVVSQDVVNRIESGE